MKIEEAPKSEWNPRHIRNTNVGRFRVSTVELTPELMEGIAGDWETGVFRISPSGCVNFYEEVELIRSYTLDEAVSEHREVVARYVERQKRTEGVEE